MGPRGGCGVLYSSHWGHPPPCPPPAASPPARTWDWFAHLLGRHAQAPGVEVRQVRQVRAQPGAPQHTWAWAARARSRSVLRVDTGTVQRRQPAFPDLCTTGRQVRTLGRIRGRQGCQAPHTHSTSQPPQGRLAGQIGQMDCLRPMDWFGIDPAIWEIRNCRRRTALLTMRLPRGGRAIRGGGWSE